MSREWTVPCKDAMGRDRTLLVRETADGEVELTWPPGESAVLTTLGLAMLYDALRLLQHPVPSGPGDIGADGAR